MKYSVLQIFCKFQQYLLYVYGNVNHTMVILWFYIKINNISAKISSNLTKPYVQVKYIGGIAFNRQ